MAFVVPNPDFRRSKPDFMAADEAMARFAKCFKPEKLSCQALTDKQRTVEIAAVESVLEAMKGDSGEDDKLVRRGGKRFVRPDEMDGAVEEDEDSEAGFEKEPFIDTQKYDADFASFMLNSIIYKLTRVLDFDTVLLLSKSGEHLYLLVRAEEKDLKKLSQQ